MSFSHTLNIISLVFLIIGGLNWGFVAILGFDPLSPILGGYESLQAKVLYGAIGIASIWTFYAYIMTPGGEDIERTR